MQAVILLVDDQESVRTNLGKYLQRHSFDVHAVADGTSALHWLAQHIPDLVVLDVQMPDVDGLDICREIRRRSGALPILMISGERQELMDRVIGLETGADKYLLKPFEPALLVAEIRSLLRTARAAGKTSDMWETITPRLRLQRAQRLVEVDGNLIPFTSLELDLLLYLIDRAGIACARDDLIEHVWHDRTGAVSDQAVNACVARVRRKIEASTNSPTQIESIYGWGYRFRLPSNA